MTTGGEEACKGAAPRHRDTQGLCPRVPLRAAWTHSSLLHDANAMAVGVRGSCGESWHPPMSSFVKWLRVTRTSCCGEMHVRCRQAVAHSTPPAQSRWRYNLEAGEGRGERGETEGESERESILVASP